MGQQHSHAAKAGQLSTINSNLTNATKERLDNCSSGFCKTEHGNRMQGLAHSSAPDSGTILSGSSASSRYATDMHTKSVRAAIDSFIEKCVVGGGDSQGCDLPHEKGVTLPWKNNELKTEKLPSNLYESSDCGSSRSTDDADKRDSENSLMDSNRHAAEMTEESPAMQNSLEVQNEPKHGPGVAGHQEAENAKLKFTKDGTAAESIKEDNSKQVVAPCDGQNQGDNATDRSNAAISSSPIKPEASRGSTTPISATTIEENSGCRPEDAGDRSKDVGDNSNDADGGRSVRLQTIIDRVLDTSLGTSSDVKTVPIEQQLLPKLAADERAVEIAKNNASKILGTSGRKTEAAMGIDSRKTEPVSVCFMEHIQEAVERSFSSITEEEERKEKEKSIIRTSSVSKMSSRSNQIFKGEPVSISGNESTISVQDIVDRVISQTEVISQMMTTSAASVSHTDTKPTASVSGIFYPSREMIGPANICKKKSSTNIPKYTRGPVDSNSQRRGGYNKDESSREAPVSDRRRGRPRMQSPYMDTREAAQQEYLQNSASRAHSDSQAGRRVLPTESMEPAVARIRPTQPSAHPLHSLMQSPFMRGMAPSSGIMPLVQLSGPGIGTLHPSAAGMHTTGGPMHAIQNPHLQASTQPPPLLKVGPMERLESQNSLQQQKYGTHVPSRSCSCSMCVMYFSCDPGGPKLPPPHPEMSMPQHSAHSPHHPYIHKAPGSSSQSSKYLHMGPLRDACDVAPDHKMDGMPRSHNSPYAPSAVVYPPSQQPLRGPPKVHPAAYSPYGIQTGVPVAPFPEGRQGVESHQHGEYNRHLDRSDFQKAPVVPSVTGQYEKSVNLPSDGPVGGRYPAPEGMLKRSAADHQVQHVRGKLGQEEGPVLDLTVKRDMCDLDDEDKPLDLSKKTSSASPLTCDRQPVGQMFTGSMRLSTEGAGDRGYVDPHSLAMSTAVAGGDRREIPLVERHLADMIPDNKLVVGSQNLHNLETNMETYFQKIPHKVQHQHNIQLSQHHASVTVAPPSGALPPSPHPHQSSLQSHQGIPLSKQTTFSHHMPLHPSTSQVSQVSQEQTLMSPLGGRRPQLHPIPAPSLSTSLGPGTSTRRASPYQGWAGGGQFGTPSATSGAHPGQQSPTVPLPPPSQQVSGFLSVATAQPASPQPPRSESRGVIIMAESGHPSASRSVSPPGSDQRGTWDDKRRGSVSKHEPLQNILGNHNPQDILYLICRQCRQTYGSPYGFRKHFRNMHGFEPKAEHTIVQTISATKNARQQAGVPQYFDNEVHGDDYSAFAQNVPVSDGAAIGPYAGSPQSDIGRLTRDSSPRSVSSESPVDTVHRSPMEGAVPSQGFPHRPRRTYSRNSSDIKTKPTSASNSSSSTSSSSSSSGTPGVVVEDREDTKCLECSECKQTFQLNDFGSYKRHCRQHGQAKGVAGAGRGPAGYTCTDCQCSFSESHQLQDHLVRHEPNSAPITCHLCTQPFSTPYLLQEHMRAVHSQVANSAFELSISSSLASSLSSALSNSTSKCMDLLSAKPAGDGGQLTACATSSPTSSAKTSAVATVADSSGFNLLVTTPSNLEVRRLPADHIVTSASPDSSSDNKKTPETMPVSSSSQLKTDDSKSDEVLSDSPPKLTMAEDPQKARSEKEGKTSKASSNSEDDKDSGYCGDRCPSNDSRSISTESSLASPMETEEAAELYLYKHKKFGAHRKRGASNDLPEVDFKQARQEHSTSGFAAPTTSLSDSQDSNSRDCSVVTSGGDNANPKTESSGEGVKTVGGAGGDKTTVQVAKSTAKTEARHQMPFVWDRVTRSQAGKHARSADYS